MLLALHVGIKDRVVFDRKGFVGRSGEEVFLDGGGEFVNRGDIHVIKNVIEDGVYLVSPLLVEFAQRDRTQVRV